MAWMRRVFRLPASETQLGLTLALCIFSMSLMAIALMWQAQVIAKQDAVIHMMEARFGGWTSGRFLFRNPHPGFFFLSPDFRLALCLNSAYGGFPKGDSSEAHPFSFRRSILSVDIFRRTAGSSTGNLDQSFHATCIETPPQSPPFEKARR
jgi:hypothetical protein